MKIRVQDNHFVTDKDIVSENNSLRSGNPCTLVNENVLTDFQAGIGENRYLNLIIIL